MPDGPLKAQLRRLLPRAVRPRRILWGPLRGFTIVTSWHDYPGAITGRTERPLLRWFERNVQVGETWLDVGAHYGYTAIALSRLAGAEGRVFAFEPMLATAGCLTRTRSLNGLPQLIVIPCGLGSPESVDLRWLPTVRGMVDSNAQLDGSWLEPFLIARLDWLWPRIAGRETCVDGVKIDVQGMEIEVIKGMSDLLAEFKPKLVVELHRGIDRRHLLDLIESLGYSRTAIPVQPLAGETEPQYLDDRSYYFERLS